MILIILLVLMGVVQCVHYTQPVCKQTNNDIDSGYSSKSLGILDHWKNEIFFSMWDCFVEI